MFTNFATIKTDAQMLDKDLDSRAGISRGWLTLAVFHGDKA